MKSSVLVVGLWEWSGLDATELMKGQQQTTTKSNQFEPEIGLFSSLHIPPKRLSV